MTGDKPKIFASAMRAWRDVFRVIPAMPTLTMAAIALGLAFGLVDIVLKRWIGATPLTFGALLAAGAVRVAWLFLMTPVYLAIHRYIILDEVASNYTLAFEQPRFMRFFLCLMAIYAIWLVPRLLLVVFGHSGVIIAAMLIATCVGAFVSTRLVILFPAVAVDAPDTSFGNAFDDTKGYFWRIFGIFIIAMVPIVVAIFAVMFLFGPLSAVIGLTAAILNILSLAVAVAIASRLYLGLSDRLGRPGPGAVGIGAA